MGQVMGGQSGRGEGEARSWGYSDAQKEVLGGRAHRGAWRQDR